MKFETAGNKTNPAVIMLNGSFTTGKGLLPMAQPLSDSYYIILPTYDGHYENGGEFTTRADQAEKIRDYLLQENIRHIALVHGVSMGAEIALTLAFVLEGSGIAADRYLFDGGPYFAFPKEFRSVMQKKFIGLLRLTQQGSTEELMARFASHKLTQRIVQGDLTPYRSMIEDIALAVPYMSEASICRESDACYTFDFPAIPKAEQKKFLFTWSDNEPAYKCKEKIKKTYPHAKFCYVKGLGHCGLLCRKPETYLRLLRKLASEKVS